MISSAKTTARHSSNCQTALEAASKVTRIRQKNGSWPEASLSTIHSTMSTPHFMSDCQRVGLYTILGPVSRSK